MANWHILPVSDFGRTRLAFHITVPSGSNSAGVTWVAAILKTRLFTGSILGSDLSAADSQAIANGTLVERVMEVSLGSDWGSLTTLQKTNRLNTLYNLEVSTLQQWVQRNLDDIGRTEATP